MNGPRAGQWVRRRTRQGWALVAGLLALAGCRELTAPAEPPAAVPRVGPVLVLDIAGDPEPLVWVTLDNRGFVPEEDELDWRERTDSAGVLHPDLPVGTYQVDVNSRNARVRDWELASIELGPEPFTLDPRPYVECGRVTFADPGYAGKALDILIEAEVKTAFGSYHPSDWSDVDPDGSFCLVRPAEDSYTVTLQGGGTRHVVARDFPLPADGPLEFYLNVISQDLELTLGGGDAPTGPIRIRATVEGNYVDDSYFAQSNRVSYWAPSGVGKLEISPLGGMAFRPEVRVWEFGDGVRPVIELGRWPVELSFVTPEGVPLHGCSFRLNSVEAQPTYYRSGFGTSLTIYLNEDDYRLESSCSGFVTNQTAFVVDGPVSRTIVMQPDP